jgi:hypothetical protein
MSSQSRTFELDLSTCRSEDYHVFAVVVVRLGKAKLSRCPSYTRCERLAFA